MQHRSLTITSLGLLGALLPAQRQYVVPPTYSTLEAPTRFGAFGGSGAMRLQFIYSMLGQPGTISQVAWRRDNDTVLTQLNYVASAQDVDVTLSSSPRTPMTISKTFATNHGADAKMVHSGVLNWPAENPAPPGPTGFVFTVPIPQPFLFLGQTDLCVDIVRRGAPTTNNPNSSMFMDSTSNSMGTGILKVGDGCPSATVNLMNVYDNWAPGATARVLQYSAAGNAPAALVIGDNNILWGGALLPYDLAPLGAPGCNVYSNHLIVIPGKNSAGNPYSGRWDLTMELPNNPLLAGLVVYLQFYNLVDVNAGNAVNVSVSQAYRVTLATPAPNKPWVSEAHGSVPPAIEASLVQQGYGFVAQFTL